MKRVLFFNLLSASFLFGFSGCCSMKIVPCPDGRPANFPKSQKCAGKLYKDVVKGFSASIKATVNVVDKVTVGLDTLGIGTKVVQLKDKLNNESIRMELLLKTSYYGLLIDPCGSNKAHQNLLKEITDRNYKLEELRVQLQSKEVTKANVKGTINDFDEIYKYMQVINDIPRETEYGLVDITDSQKIIKLFSTKNNSNILLYGGDDFEYYFHLEEGEKVDIDLIVGPYKYKIENGNSKIFIRGDPKIGIEAQIVINKKIKGWLKYQVHSVPDRSRINH